MPEEIKMCVEARRPGGRWFVRARGFDREDHDRATAQAEARAARLREESPEIEFRVVDEGGLR